MICFYVVAETLVDSRKLRVQPWYRALRGPRLISSEGLDFSTAV